MTISVALPPPQKITHSERLDVRVHPELKAQLIELASLRRMTPAEAAREALRSYVALVQ